MPEMEFEGELEDMSVEEEEEKEEEVETCMARRKAPSSSLIYSPECVCRLSCNARLALCAYVCVCVRVWSVRVCIYVCDQCVISVGVRVCVRV